MGDNLANPPWEICPLPSNHLQWNRQCPHCHVTFTNETPRFCCRRNGSCLTDVVPLPPLPAEYNTFINSPDISPASRILNLIFSFAALKSTAEFPATLSPPGFFAIQGCIYHRLRPNPELQHLMATSQWLYEGPSAVSTMDQLPSPALDNRDGQHVAPHQPACTAPPASPPSAPNPLSKCSN
ncbi:hypothetical protein M407DRAFT_28540 [Tulasnella calospora MUT 4182]|uniref:Uncharacterized protein n=1 Tax=Tulasnella calospora MUT 4182 TaxID=1051891 RepID=A0A0C3LKN9_9AGAM|nr:hypothetical protein M407DRAFT_28540 [Tulasnella calospora MUT 4182]